MVQERTEARVEGISILLYGHLSRYSKGLPEPIVASVHPGERLRDVIERLKIPCSEIGLTLINGRLTSTLDVPAHPGDEVKLFGLVGGG